MAEIIAPPLPEERATPRMNRVKLAYLIKRAIKNKWRTDDHKLLARNHNRPQSYTWEYQVHTDLSISLVELVGEDNDVDNPSEVPSETSSLNDLLFGDNLSFLKSLVGDDLVCDVCGSSDLVVNVFDEHECRIHERSTNTFDRADWLAQQLVILGDVERVSTLYGQVFGEEK